MGPMDYPTHVHGPFESYARFHNHHGFYHDRIFQDEERREYICRYCPCEIISCSARFANSASLTEHLWEHHTTDTKALKFYMHKYCNAEAGQGNQCGAVPRLPAKLNSNLDAILGKIPPGRRRKSSAFNFDISRMLASGDNSSAGMSECQPVWNDKFPPRALDGCIKPIVRLPVIRADDHCSSYVHGTDRKGSDDGSK
jgi:hypothetical protein